MSPKSGLLHKNKPFVVVLGPTAVGKSDVAITLAEKLNGEIVSADSRLFYRGMDIGTAKPSLADRQRVPHHLIDIADPDQVLSLVAFQKAAHQVIEDIYQRERLPFLVGGTGQYIRAVVQTWEAPPIEPNPELRHALEEWSQEIGVQGLHSRLAILDGEAAARIDARNVRRTIRALEVIFSSGKLFSRQITSGESPYDLLQVGLKRPRDELYKRIDDRIQIMLDAGWVEEVRTLLEKGYSTDLPSLSAIGYREIVRYLQGEVDLEDAVALIKRQTRVYVRRQANWFKEDDTQIHWFDVQPGVEQEIIAFVMGWLSELAPGV